MEEAKNGMWSFRSKATPAPTATSSAPFIKKDTEPAAAISIGKTRNVFQKLEGIREEKEQKPEKKYDAGGKWSIGTKKVEEIKQPIVEKKPTPAIVIPPPV